MINDFSLDAPTRDQYLEAMGITQWVLRDTEADTIEHIPEAERVFEKGATTLKNNAELSQNKSDSSDIVEGRQGAQIEPENLAENAAAQAQRSKPTKSLQPQSNHSTSENQSSEPKLESSQIQDSTAGFVKMVNWPFTNEGDNRLLILCRHHKDQPAQSFAAPSGPSQFMIDYLNAIKQACVQLEGGLSMSMGHLTEAGIGRGHQPFAKAIEGVKPRLILLMGEEAVRHMLGAEQRVAQMRMRVHQQRGLRIIVTYHPFELISQPALKKLALEDLYFVQQVLNAEA